MFGLFSPVPSTKAYEQKQLLQETMYARYQEILKSSDFKRYQELKEYVESPEHKKELAVIRALSYKNSKEAMLEKRLKELRKYKEVKIFRQSGVDSDSPYVREYIDLEDKVASPSFRQHKAYLQNKNRYKESEQYLKQKEYQRLVKSEHVKQYYKIQQKYAAAFTEITRWETKFNDEFNEPRLSEQWGTRPYWSTVLFDRNYSHNEEEHRLSEGQNIQFAGNVVQIITRREQATGLAWDEKQGFIPRVFDYTSDMLSTAHYFEMQYGRLEAKLCFPNVKNLYSVCWLGSGRPLPTISVAHYCNKRLVMGAYADDKVAAVTKKLTLKNNTFYVFQLERTPTTLTWYINGKKMFECANPSSEPLYIALTAGVLGATNDALLPAAFECDYVKMEQLKCGTK